MAGLDSWVPGDDATLDTEGNWTLPNQPQQNYSLLRLKPPVAADKDTFGYWQGKHQDQQNKLNGIIAAIRANRDPTKLEGVPSHSNVGYKSPTNVLQGGIDPDIRETYNPSTETVFRKAQVEPPGSLTGWSQSPTGEGLYTKIGPLNDPITQPYKYANSADPMEVVNALRATRGMKQAGRSAHMTPQEREEYAKRLEGVTRTAAGIGVSFANPVLGAAIMASDPLMRGDYTGALKEGAQAAIPFGVLKAAREAPRLTAATLGAFGSYYPDAVAADKAPVNTRPSFTPEDTKRMQTLEGEIKELQKQQQKQLSESSSKRGGNILESFKPQISAKQGELDKMRSDMLERQSAYDKATLPISARDPDAMLKARYAGLGGSLASGTLAGMFANPKKYKWAPWLLSGALGALEGGAGVTVPSMIDLGQPEGTPAKEQAERNLSFFSDPSAPGAWNFARKTIAPEAGMGAVLGLIGHGIGHNVGTAGSAIGKGMRSLLKASPQQEKMARALKTPKASAIAAPATPVAPVTPPTLSSPNSLLRVSGPSTVPGGQLGRGAMPEPLGPTTYEEPLNVTPEQRAALQARGVGAPPAIAPPKPTPKPRTKKKSS